MNLNSFLTGFFYGFACFSTLGVVSCIWVGYVGARSKLGYGAGYCASCCKECVVCRCKP